MRTKVKQSLENSLSTSQDGMEPRSSSVGARFRLRSPYCANAPMPATNNKIRMIRRFFMSHPSARDAFPAKADARPDSAALLPRLSGHGASPPDRPLETATAPAGNAPPPDREGPAAALFGRTESPPRADPALPPPARGNGTARARADSPPKIVPHSCAPDANPRPAPPVAASADIR